MEVLLLEKVQNLGNLGDLVSVRPGFGRNYLIPRGKAVPATKENREKFEARRAELEKALADAIAQAQARQQQIDGLVITIGRRAGDEGKLFGSIGTQDIVDAANEVNVVIKKNEVRMPMGPIRQSGDHEVDIHLHPDVNAKIVVRVVAETGA